MSEKEDGGPAFPQPVGRMDQPVCNGMSLRDWFAGQMLTSDWPDWDDAQIARACYRMADALLAERSKR